MWVWDKSARLNNKVLADKDEVDKDEAKNHMIVSFIISALQLLFFFAWVLSNIVLLVVFWFVAMVLL